jgi:hypothetical protein
MNERAGQGVAEVSLSEDKHVIQALAPDRADEPLGILPRALRRRENLLDSHALHAVPEPSAVDLITIPQKIGGRGLLREDVDERSRQRWGAIVAGRGRQIDQLAGGRRFGERQQVRAERRLVLGPRASQFGQLFQIDPVRFRGRVAFCVASPRNHGRRGVSGRRSR